MSLVASQFRGSEMSTKRPHRTTEGSYIQIKLNVLVIV